VVSELRRSVQILGGLTSHCFKLGYCSDFQGTHLPPQRASLSLCLSSQATGMERGAEAACHFPNAVIDLAAV